LKIDAHLKTAPKPENKNYNHLKPISGQGSARIRVSIQIFMKDLRLQLGEPLFFIQHQTEEG
jgi:hypothetical protein